MAPSPSSDSLDAAVPKELRTADIDSPSIHPLLVLLSNNMLRPICTFLSISGLETPSNFKESSESSRLRISTYISCGFIRNFRSFKDLKPSFCQSLSNLSIATFVLPASTIRLTSVFLAPAGKAESKAINLKTSWFSSMLLFICWACLAITAPVGPKNLSQLPLTIATAISSLAFSSMFFNAFPSFSLFILTLSLSAALLFSTSEAFLYFFKSVIRSFCFSITGLTTISSCCLTALPPALGPITSLYSFFINPSPLSSLAAKVIGVNSPFTSKSCETLFFNNQPPVPIIPPNAPPVTAPTPDSVITESKSLADPAP